ncbi:hypothetical protein NDN08_007758 [Rhodosorus marinus]|uniref:ATPase AAA-type core domain-containing protein n=1 Tax=Rhodosorus marinus TaxID=101924 RepID=A0AAV8UYS6_9RHOD|nr:hypothetical protein NDN08_007758 [Rhodosorus marinus]
MTSFATPWRGDWARSRARGTHVRNRCVLSARLLDIGQAEAVNALESLLGSERGVPQRLLFIGPDGTGKKVVAKWLLTRMHDLGMLDMYRVFVEGDRERVVRNWLQNVGDRLPKTNLPSGFAMCDSLLEKSSIRNAVVSAADQGMMQIYFSETDKDLFRNGLRAYKVPFYPLETKHCATVLRTLGFQEEAENDVAIASSHGCYEEAVYTHEWMKQLDLPWEELRMIPPSGINVQRLRRAEQEEAESVSAAGNVPQNRTTAARMLAISKQICRNTHSMADHRRLLTFLDHLWANDMETCCILNSDPSSHELNVNHGVRAHMALLGGMDILEGCASPELVYNVMFLKASGLVPLSESTVQMPD